MINYQYIEQTPSTNALLWERIRKENLPDGFALRTDFQTAGKGQVGNSWEAEAGKNVLFSMVLSPTKIAPDKQFLLSQLVSVAIKQVLESYVEDITVKWPNDIYWKEMKLGGILIENLLQGKSIRTSVIGIGINVNQEVFLSDAPNPISLIQITGKSLDCQLLFADIREAIIAGYKNLHPAQLRIEYADSLYRRNGFHAFRSDVEEFEAQIISVEADGKLVLETKDEVRKEFYFKEVSFVHA